jgi:hypothetical protein
MQRREWKANPETFADKVNLRPEDAAIVAAEVKAEDEARGK